MIGYLILMIVMIIKINYNQVRYILQIIEAFNEKSHKQLGKFKRPIRY